MKLKYLLLLPMFLLGACGNGNVDTSSLKIVCPTGAPSVAFYNEANNPNFETNSTPSNIVAMINDASDKDVVVIDTVSGIKAIGKGAPYKIAANITLGNFYIASTGNDEDKVMNEGDTIVLFGQNQTPDLVFHYIYGNAFDSSIEYVTNVQDASKCLASGKNLVTSSDVDYVFVAQPVLFAVLNNKDAKTYGKSSVYVNIQEEYKKKSNNLSLIQASVFVKNTTDKKLIDGFLKTLNTNITKAIDTPSIVKEGMESIGSEEAIALYGINPNVAVKVLENNNSLGLGYIKASDNKEAIDNFVNLFGMEGTNEEIYY